MEGFLSWFFAFMTTMIQGVWRIFSNFFGGIIQIFNFPAYFDQIQQYKSGFSALDWILCIITLILSFAVWALIFFMIALIIRKYIRFRRSLVGNEDLLEEIADLHRDVIKLTKEKERILNLKVGQTGISVEQLKSIYSGEDSIEKLDIPSEIAEKDLQNTADTGTADTVRNDNIRTDTPMPETVMAGGNVNRFIRLTAVDEKYEFYKAPDYVRNMSLIEICEDIRNFACSKMNLFYDLKTIRLLFAGLASTKLILLQGISGTGKTSLPYTSKMMRQLPPYNRPGETEPSFSDILTSLQRGSMKPRY